MTKISLPNYSLILFLFLFNFYANSLKATHIPGANITYVCNPSNPLEYTFRLTVFRKCPGTHSSTMSSSLFTLTNDCGWANPVVPAFNQVGTEIDVNQLCDPNASNCNGGTQPGIWKYVYEGTLLLPANCDGWHLEYDLCCRDQSSNMSGGSGNSMVTSTTLNTSTSPCNNSPTVTAAPIPYACTNTNFNYCLTISDLEGDSVSFSMVAPLTFGAVPISHEPGFSANQPLSNFNLDSQTGCLSLNEPNIGNYVVAILIKEWNSNGDLLSEIIHDFQIIVVNCSNTPPRNPIGGISNFTGSGSLIDSNSIALCLGNTICFDVVFDDPIDTGDILTITTDGTTLLPGATFTQTGTNPVRGTFCWNAQAGYTGNIITFIVQDNGCPIVGTSSFAVNLDIITGVYSSSDVTICGTQSTQLQAYGSSAYTWSPATGLSCTNCPNPIAQPTTTTTYTLSGNLVGSCNNNTSITVYVVPDYTITMTPVSSSVCANQAIQLEASGPSSFGPYTYTWSPGTTLSNTTIANPFAQPYTSTTYTVTMTAANGCTQVTSTSVQVTGIGPTIYTTPIDTNICEGESIEIDAVAGIYPLTCGVSTGCTGTPMQAQIGTSTSNSILYSPFYGSTSTTSNYTKKSQIIYTASELNSLGYYGGTIQDLALYITRNNNYQYDHVTVWIGCTNLNEFPSNTFIPTSSLTQVLGPLDNVNPTDNNWHVFDIIDYDWDGMSNIIVQICAQEDETQDEGFQAVQYSSTAPAYQYIDQASTDTTNPSCSNTSGYRETSRPNIRFTICQTPLVSPNYQWSPSLGLSNTNTPNTIASPTTSTSYILNVTDSSGCVGSAIVNVNISPDYTIHLTASDSIICYGDSVLLNASATPIGSGPWTYQWFPSTGLSNVSIANPIAKPTVTRTYTVIASNGSCEKTASITVDVAGGPNTVDITISPYDTVCPYDIVNFNTYNEPSICGITSPGCPTGGVSNQGVSGTGSSSSSSYGPFDGNFSTTYSYKRQYIFTAQELNLMGFDAGKITELAFEVSSNATHDFNDITILMGATNLNDFVSSTFEPSSNMIQVDYNTIYTATTGWNTFLLDNGFNWDGTSNIIIQICGRQNIPSGSLSTTYTCDNYRQLYYRSSTSNACTQPRGDRTTCRANIRFTMCKVPFDAGTSYTWSSTGNLSSTTIPNPSSVISSNHVYSVSVVEPINSCIYEGSIPIAIYSDNAVIATEDTTICSSGNTNIQLNATYNGTLPPVLQSCATGQTCSGINDTEILGSTSISTTSVSPFYGGTNYSKRIQYIYTASELNAQGIVSGVINNIALFVESSNNYTYDDVQVWIGCTNLTRFPSDSFIDPNSMSLIFTGSNINPVDSAWQVFNTLNYGWDGTSSIIIQICAKESSLGTAGSESVGFDCVGANRCLYKTSTSALACNSPTGFRTTCRATMRFNVCSEYVPAPTYTWSPSTGLSNPNIQNPIATVGTTTQYVVQATAGTNCVVYDTVNIIVNNTLAAPLATPIMGTYCPNTNLTLTASGGSGILQWYTGRNGTGTWLGSGNNYTFAPNISGQTYYVRGESTCGNTADDSITVDLKEYTYALNATTTSNYCTDNNGWHHFFNNDEILFSVQGDLTNIPVGFPEVTIWDNGTWYQQTQGPSMPTACATNSSSPGEERFEMERSWNVNIGSGILSPPYNVRFYYEPTERTAIENAAINWMTTYTACGYSYKYANPLGLYWFKNIGADYTAPDYDGLQLTNTDGITPNGINYSELIGINSFSGGSAAITLAPNNLLPLHWLSFDGMTIDKTNHLNWTTLSEDNAAHFEIERSKDGINFSSIGTVDALGNLGTTNNYIFNDVNPFQGNNYYRLKLVEQDGQHSLSNTILLTIKANRIGYKFYPNPTDHTVYYQYEATTSETITIEVLDILGREVTTSIHTSTVGFNNIPINLSAYPNGTYMVRVHHKSTQQVHSSKIIKGK